MHSFHANSCFRRTVSRDQRPPQKPEIRRKLARAYRHKSVASYTRVGMRLSCNFLNVYMTGNLVNVYECVYNIKMQTRFSVDMTAS